MFEKLKPAQMVMKFPDCRVTLPRLQQPTIQRRLTLITLVHIPTISFLEINVNIILPSKFRSFRMSLFFGFSELSF
jgi:hypothetical protein